MADLINPYIAGNPVTGKEMFFGRDDIFDFIRRTLTGQHRDQVIVLYGQRRTGKTSILYQLHRHLDPRYLCIFIDLHGLNMENEANLLWDLANQIRRILRRDHAIDIPTPDRNAFEAEPRSTFTNDFLDTIWAAAGDRHLLLMIDEAVRLQEQVSAGKLDKSIFEFLRHLMQHYERLNFLFSIGSGLEQMEKEYAFLFNVALYKKISFLERAAAVDLITLPMRDTCRVEPAAVDRILEVTACHPYFTQLLCHSLFNRRQQRGNGDISLADVEAVLDEVVERGLAVLKHTWEESTPEEKAVLVGLVSAMGDRNRPVDRTAPIDAWRQQGVSLPGDEAARAMKSLAARDILHGDEQVEFNIDLQYLWVRKFQRIEWVGEEIRGDIQRWQVAPAEQLPAAVAEALPAPRGSPASMVLVFVGVALLLGAAVLLAAVFDLGPFGNESTGTTDTESQQTQSGRVVPGGDAMLVNDLAVAGGAVWAATEAGLVNWSSEGEAIVFPGDAYGFPEPAIQTLAVAGDGTMWVGGGGVSHVEPSKRGILFLDYFDRDSNLGMGVVRALMVDDDQSIWAGGNTAFESPISRFDGEAWDYDALPLESLESQGIDLRVWSFLRDFDGELWIGLISDGILRWDGENWTHWGPGDGVGGTDANQDSRVRGLVQDDQGNLWAAASDRGLLIYMPDTDSWDLWPAVEITDRVTAIAFFDDTSLWAGQHDGAVLRSFDYGNTWDVIAWPDDNLGEDITAIVRDEAGRIFVSSYGGGVSVYENGTWTRLHK